MGASEAEVTQRLSHLALWGKVDLAVDLGLVSVADSGEGSMEVAAVVASEVEEVVVVSRTVDQGEAEVVSAIKAVDLAAVMVAEVTAIEDLERLHQMPQLDLDRAAVATLAAGMVKARRIAVAHPLVVGMNHAVVVLLTTIEDQARVGTEVVIDMVVREEATTVVVAEATWSR